MQIKLIIMKMTIKNNLLFGLKSSPTNVNNRNQRGWNPFVSVMPSNEKCPVCKKLITIST